MSDTTTTVGPDLSDQEKEQPNVTSIIDPRPVVVDGTIVGMASLSREEQVKYATGEKTGETFVIATFQPVGRGRAIKARWKHLGPSVDIIREGLAALAQARADAEAAEAKAEAEAAAQAAKEAAEAAAAQAEAAAAKAETKAPAKK